MVDDVIQSVLAEEDAKKKARKAEKEGLPKSKGLTLQEIEVGSMVLDSPMRDSAPPSLSQDAEGGVIKESLVHIAQAKRASTRKKVENAADDTEMPEDVDRFEEEKPEVEVEWPVGWGKTDSSSFTSHISAVGGGRRQVHGLQLGRGEGDGAL